MAEFFSTETQSRLLSTIKQAGHVSVQNALMSLPDREVALAIGKLEKEQIDEILDAVATSKAGRIREEIDLAKQRRVADQHRNAAMRHVIAALSGERPRDIKRSYFRPRRPKG